MRRDATWRPVTAAEYDEELRAALDDIERLRAAVWDSYRGHGMTAAAPRRAADLRDLRQAIAALRAGAFDG